MLSFAIGVGTRSREGAWLDVYYPAPAFQPGGPIVDALRRTVGADATGFTPLDGRSLAALAPALRAAGAEEQATVARACQGAARPVVLTVLRDDAPVASVPEAYLKLHLLSHRCVLPNALDLEGLFATLQNVAWTSEGPIAPDELAERRLRARALGRTLTVLAVDKFPRMVDYVVPNGVRIADADRIRLGAYLGDGTTVMHEGFVNFNAGARGPNMIEGRISQGVIVGEGSDLGGSASTAGTLSGGGDVRISIGRNCLVSANAGTGIPLGDRCTIEAGLYITPGTVVSVLDEQRSVVRTVKARELSGQDDMLFIRNSQTGVVECRTNRRAIELNPALHAND